MKRPLSIFVAFTILLTMFIPQGIVSGISFNYGEALQKSIYFYTQQRSGYLPPNFPVMWRGDSCRLDGASAGLDLTGGWYSSGDHMKFNLPMAYSATMLGWGVYEYRSVFENAGVMKNILDEIKWATDYLIKCHPSPNEYYYQLGDPNISRPLWVPEEVVDQMSTRPAYKLDLANPGSSAVGEAAAALAVASILFRSTNPSYASLCLSHAKSLYDYADAVKSDAGYTAAAGYYNAWSGFWDELTWGAVWLYLATGDSSYLAKAESYTAKLNYTDPYLQWTIDWDDKTLGATLLLARITGKPQYIAPLEKNLNYLLPGGGAAYTPGGLIYINSCGSLPYAANASFLAFLWADSGLASNSNAYRSFGERQINYILGNNPRNSSYMIGFGYNYPRKPHHSTAHGSWTGDMYSPPDPRHILVGALVGGPSGKDDYSYKDSIDEYMCNGVACEYNAALTGCLAKMYSTYGGTILPNFPGPSDFARNLDPTPEYLVRAQANPFNGNSLEVVAYISNRSAWPAQVKKNMSFRYYVDLSEVINAGYPADSVTASVVASDCPVTITGPHYCSGNVYYYEAEFYGTFIYPGSPSATQKKVDFTLNSPVAMDYANDWSFRNLPQAISSDPTSLDGYTGYIPVFDSGVRLGGEEPAFSISTPTPTNTLTPTPTATPTPTTTPTPTPTAQGSLRVQFYNANTSITSNTIYPYFRLVNTGTSPIILSDVKVKYYYTIDGEKAQNFFCDWATAGTSNVTAAFGKMVTPKTGADYFLEVGFTSGAGSLAAGASSEVRVRFSKSDWSNYTQTNDYSFNPTATNYTDYTKVTIHLLDWGTEP